MFPYNILLNIKSGITPVKSRDSATLFLFNCRRWDYIICIFCLQYTQYTFSNQVKLLVTVHFVHSNVLDGLWINTSIEKIGNVSVPQLMRGYIKVQRISDFGLIFLGHAQRWGNRVFDALYTMPASPIDKVYPRPEIHNPIAACL